MQEPLNKTLEVPNSWVISKVLHKRVGLKAALFFHYLQMKSIFAEKPAHPEVEDYFTLHTDTVMQETLFSKMEQINARKKLIAIGLLEEKRVLMHARVYFKLKLNVLHKLNLEASEA